MTAPLTTDYSRGFGGRYGVEKDKRDKAALGYDYKGETEKHESQRGELGLEGGKSQIAQGSPSFLSGSSPRGPRIQRGQMCRAGGAQAVSTCRGWMVVVREERRGGEENSRIKSRA